MLVILATHNQGKLKEFKEMIKNHEIVSLKDLKFEEDIEELLAKFSK